MIHLWSLGFPLPRAESNRRMGHGARFLQVSSLVNNSSLHMNQLLKQTMLTTSNSPFWFQTNKPLTKCFIITTHHLKRPWWEKPHVGGFHLPTIFFLIQQRLRTSAWNLHKSWWVKSPSFPSPFMPPMKTINNSF